MNYNFFTKNKTTTPQNQPIPGREAEMVQGRSGGFMFDAGIWKMLRRCLLVGTAKSTYYAGKQELTEDFVAVVRLAVAENPSRVAEEIQNLRIDKKDNKCSMGYRKRIGDR